MKTVIPCVATYCAILIALITIVGMWGCDASNVIAPLMTSEPERLDEEMTIELPEVPEEEMLVAVKTRSYVTVSVINLNTPTGMVAVLYGDTAGIALFTESEEGWRLSGEISGVGSLPPTYFTNNMFDQEKFLEDLNGSGFGSSISMYEYDKPKSIAAGGAALLAIGAPNDAGAVFVFRITPEEIWLEQKLSPPPNTTRYGKEVQFYRNEHGEYLQVESEEETFIIEVENFLTLG